MSIYLAKGQRSNNVVGLQNALNKALRLAKPLVLDGIFGPLTDAAVRQFQKRERLTCDGIAGPKTLGALFQGVNVKTRIAVRATGKGPAVRGSPTPAGTPATAPAPDPAVPKPSLSFGTIGLFHRELRLRNWLLEDFPKSKLLAPPPFLFGSSLSLDALRLRGIPIDRLSLTPGEKSVTKRATATSGFGCELELKGTTSDLKEFEYELEFSCLQPKFEGFFKPGVALKPSPDGGWSAELNLDVKPFELLEKDWKRFSLELNPLVSGSVTVPFIRGVDPNSVEIFGGLEGELKFRPILKAPDFELFFGGKAGAIGSFNFRDGKFEGATLAPGLEASGGARFSF